MRLPWRSVRRSAFAGPVNINTADAATLAAELTGVGPALAEAIVKDRAEHGNFDSPEALARVKGIGDRIVEMNTREHPGRGSGADSSVDRRVARAAGASSHAARRPRGRARRA